MEIVNRELVCTDCAKSFIFSAGEQLFFKEKNFINDPKRCKICKAKRATENLRVLPESQVQCEECGVLTTVPFRPRQGRPVYCRACFQMQPKRPVATKPEVVRSHSGPIQARSRDSRASDHSVSGSSGDVVERGVAKGSAPAPLRMMARDKGPARPFTSTLLSSTLLSPIQLSQAKEATEPADGGMQLLRTS